MCSANAAVSTLPETSEVEGNRTNSNCVCIEELAVSGGISKYTAACGELVMTEVIADRAFMSTLS